MKTKAKAKAAVVPSLTIGVDNTTPAGHNWEYTAFFPETGVNVHAGDTIDFHWSPTSSTDSLHTVAFYPDQPATSEATFRAAHPILTQQNGVGEENELLQNNDVFLPQPPPVSPALPCGFVEFGTAPCTFDNVAPFVSSGAVPGGAQPGAPTHFQVTVANTVPLGTYKYVCLIHPNMTGQITVVAPATPVTTQAQADAAAATQYNALTAAAGPVELADLTPTFTMNNNGSKTWNQLMGAEAGEVQILETLPPTLPINAGDSVTFANITTQEVHTATMPLGPAGFALGPFGTTVCEGPPEVPPPNPNGPPPFGCANYAAYEQPFNPAPQGEPTTISSGATAASTGVLFPTPAPLQHSRTYSFPKNGNFTYFCFFHAGMVGTVYTSHYRETASDGGEFTFGGADFFGSMGGKTLDKPMVGQAETSDAQGYWQVASDGGVFTFGDARFFGSMGGKPLDKPVVGIAATPDGGGYWEVASDGGVFTFGDAQFFGSMGGIALDKPVVGIAATPDGGGYWEVASDGGVFTFGDAPFFGSMGGIALAQPVVGIAATIDGGGYWEVASDGGVFTFGDAPFFGSMGGVRLTKPVVGLTGS